MASGGSFICVEAVGSRRGLDSDKELKRTLQKPAPSWTVVGNISDMGTFIFHITQFLHAIKTIFKHL